MWVFCILGVLLVGCSSKHLPVDQVKSCEALLYEAESIDFLLEAMREEVAAAKARPIALHLFIVAAGTAISLQPALLAGESFYLAPAATIGYYNLLAAPPEALARHEILSKQQETLTQLIEEKECKNKTRL